MSARTTIALLAWAVALLHAASAAAQDAGVPDADAGYTDEAPEGGAPAGDDPGEGDADDADSDDADSDDADSDDEGGDDEGGDYGDEGDGDVVDDPDAPTADTGIRGRIVDAHTGEGLPDAVVIARREGQVENTVTNETGGYVLVVPPGTYSVLSYTDLYHGARMRRVVVRSARWRDLTLTLEPIDADAVAEEVEIVYRADTASAAAQDQLRAASSGIGEGMGSEQMSQSGASDAGSAARNVAGVSLEGTNLNIRGLGGAYTLVLLNGVQLPSTDPDSPSVDLDLFPTSIIDNLFVSKAFLPNLPGNFAGGVLDIRTVRFPREFTLQLGIGTGANTLSTFQDQLTYRGGGLDVLGIDDGTRAMPDGLDQRLTVSGRFDPNPGPYMSDADIEPIAERFPNIWQFGRAMGVPDVDVEAVMGDSFDLGGDNRFGYLVTAGYEYQQRRAVGVSRPRPTAVVENDRLQDLVQTNDYNYEVGGEEVRLFGLGTASLELGQEHLISFLSLFNRTTTDETSRTTGYDQDLEGPLERWQLQMVSRTMWFNQLRGDHRNLFGERLRLRWSAYGAYAARDEPDRRTVAYGQQGDISDRWLEKSQSGERFYSELGQLDFGGTLDLRFPLWTQAFGSVGGHLRTSSRDFANRRFRFQQSPSATDQNAYTAPVEELLGPDGNGPLTRLREFTRDNDSYSSQQDYYAGYLMLETPLGDALSLTAGARFEAFRQLVASASPIEAEQQIDPDPADLTDRTDMDVLPGASLRLEVADGMFLRAAYGMTARRPNIRELAPYQYYDFVRDRNINGNPMLQRTLIQNADLRWEWFFDEGEILAFSVFYKYLDQPIELQIQNPTTYDSAFVNASYAHNLGGEAELRFNFRHLAPELSFLSFSGTFAVVWSQVTLPDSVSGAVTSSRQLFGQSPYVANLSLVLDEPETGISASVVYNLTGPRLTDVGTRQNTVLLPNIERSAFHSLDVILGWRFEEHWRLRLKFRNLLFQAQEFVFQSNDDYEGGFLTQRIDPGMSASLSLGFEY